MIKALSDHTHAILLDRAYGLSEGPCEFCGKPATQRCTVEERSFCQRDALSCDRCGFEHADKQIKPATRREYPKAGEPPIEFLYQPYDAHNAEAVRRLMKMIS